MADIARNSQTGNGPLADPLEAFTARCQARATLYANGEFDLHEAVDVLQDFAVSLGLVESIGQDEVQRIIAAAFQPVQVENCYNNFRDITFSRVAASTLAAAEYLARTDSKQFETWLLQHSPDERAAIMAHLQKKRDRA